MVEKRAVVTLQTELKDKSESKLLREGKIAKAAIMSRDFFFLESILSLNKRSSYIYTNFIATCLISLNFICTYIESSQRLNTLSLKINVRVGIG